jgi:hypothetical protein
MTPRRIQTRRVLGPEIEPPTKKKAARSLPAGATTCTGATPGDTFVRCEHCGKLRAKNRRCGETRVQDLRFRP